ncbi:hypothetical protein VA596_22645 [Amycolatopsis sp., V23-08]|uniref:Secreted protein n=1 Tax=Amycolatopsis heterodermiae TaxID=3110235 RepID=A0ABU5R977_9PSEU|nr:hypothetical protein [Amycolatopsis sp., V23-08]MEA5362354.1 hypothetical protein [Amycolatopsis sp., V23-08]
MRATIAQRAGLAGALLVTALAATTAPARADQQAGLADIGSADFTTAGSTSTIPAQGRCSIDGPTSATAEPVSQEGITFGGGTSSCTTTVTDPETGATTTTSTATGKKFELSALMSVGGPRVKLSTFTVTCTASRAQTSTNWSYGGMAGIPAPPSPVPAGYVAPIKKRDGTVLANAVFNTQTLPGDGSIGLTMLEITFLPASGITGRVVLGETACAPTQ